eukprot:NODE_107_length_18988_cov_0.534491.p16 type:complete len:168 gc:universal NODE_107_length_18988_cov_0.534491:17788-17285(-)
MLNWVTRFIYTMVLLTLLMTIVGTIVDLYVQIEKRPTKYAYQIILIFLYGIVIISALFLGCIRFVNSYNTMSKIPSFDLQINGKYEIETNLQTRQFIQWTKPPTIEQIDIVYLQRLYQEINWNEVDLTQKKIYKAKTNCIFKKLPTEVELLTAMQILEFLSSRDQSS